MIPLRGVEGQDYSCRLAVVYLWKSPCTSDSITSHSLILHPTHEVDTCKSSAWPWLPYLQCHHSWRLRWRPPQPQLPRLSWNGKWAFLGRSDLFIIDLDLLVAIKGQYWQQINFNDKQIGSTQKRPTVISTNRPLWSDHTRSTSVLLPLHLSKR